MKSNSGKSEIKKLKMVKLYTEDLLSLGKIGEILGVSRQYVKKVLNSLGIDTSKAGACNIKFNCDFCGEETTSLRCNFRKNNFNFCNRDCYMNFLKENGKDYKPWRQGQRIARSTVEGAYGELPPGSIVHHIDGDNHNNDLSNLMLFAAAKDHLKWHRGNGNESIILWRGDII
jgi:hypothetical protein